MSRDTARAADAEGTKITFDRLTTQLDALQRAAYAVADMMTVDITASGDRYVCTLYPRDLDADSGMLAHRVRSEVIDQTSGFLGCVIGRGLLQI